MEIEKKPLAPLLKNLKLKQFETYPLKRYSSIKQTIQRLQMETDMKFSMKKNEGMFEVMRIK